MTNDSEFADDRPTDELPQPYRAAVEAILAEPIPEIDIQRLIRSRLSPRMRSAGPMVSLASFGARLMTPRNLVVIAAAVAVIIMVSQWISSSNGNFAFAQVQEQVEKVKSVQYTMVEKVLPISLEKSPSLKGKKPPQMSSRMMFLGDSLQRIERTVTPGDKLEDGTSWEPARDISILDAKRGKMIDILPEKKAYVLIHVDEASDGKDHSREKKLTWRTMFDELLRSPADSVKRLPEKEVDGKMAVGFVTEHEEKTDQFVTTSRSTYWIDTKTKLPIRIEFTTHFTNPEIKDFDLVDSDFVFDAPLDPALFSTEPPKGYKNLNPQPSNPPDKPLRPGRFVPAPSGRLVPAPKADKPDK